MRQILESILGLKIKIGDLIRFTSSDSHNKTEYHFHGTVNFIEKPEKKSLPPLPRQITKR